MRKIDHKQVIRFSVCLEPLLDEQGENLVGDSPTSSRIFSSHRTSCSRLIGLVNHIKKTSKSHSWKSDASRNLSKSVRFEYSAKSKTEENLEPKLFLKILRQEVDKLPENQRICLHLYLQESMSFADLRDILSLSESSVRIHLRRGLEALHKGMKQANILLSQPKLVKAIQSMPKEVAPPSLVQKIIHTIDSRA